MVRVLNMFFVFKPETAYEMRIGDWSSDVCSSDLVAVYGGKLPQTVTDDTPQRPTTSYGNQKLTGELMINDYSRKGFVDGRAIRLPRSEEHTSELQSLMRISYAVFCLKKTKHTKPKTNT